MEKQKAITPGITPAANGRFRARLSAGGERAHLGTFNTLDEAEAALADAKRIYRKIKGHSAGVRRDNKSGTPGVHWSEKDQRWIARHRGTYIGSYREKWEATRARLDHEIYIKNKKR
jgi:hypothetical protein